MTIGNYTIAEELVVSAETVDRYQSFPTATQCPDGTMLCCYKDGTGHETGGDLLIRRHTGGAWGAPVLMFEHATETDQWQEGNLVRRADGRIFLYADRFGRDGGVAWSEFWVRYSDDSGANWSEAEQIDQIAGFGSYTILLEHACQFAASGDRLLATAWGTRSGEVKFSNACIESQDGIHWSIRSWIGGGDAVGLSFSECSTIRMSNGRLICLHRNDTSERCYQSFSDDDGYTWTTPVNAWGTHMGQAPVMLQVPDGALLAIGRCAHNVFCLHRSTNYGLTWDSGTTLDAYASLAAGGYGDFAYDEDGKLHVIFYTDDVSADPWIAERIITLLPPQRDAAYTLERTA